MKVFTEKKIFFADEHDKHMKSISGMTAFLTNSLPFCRCYAIKVLSKINWALSTLCF